MKSLICLCFFFATPIASASAQTASTESELLAGAHQRIEKYRKIDGVIRVVDRDESVSGAQVRIEQTRHGFMFGCNAFPLLGHRDPALAAVYQKQFADLFNYATLGIYWGAYELAR